MQRKTIFDDLSGPDGHLNEEGTALYVDALFLGKTAMLPAHILDHVADCMSCRREVASLYDLVTENKALYPPVSHPVFDKVTDSEKTGSVNAAHKRRMWRIWSVAAAILLVFCVGGAILYYNARISREDQIQKEIVEKIRPGLDEESPVSAQEETLHYSHITEVPSAAGGNPRLEAMFNMQLRGHDFRLSSPQKVTRVKKLDRLAWEWQAGNEVGKLTLMVLDEAGINRNQIRLSQKKYEFIVDLPPGLYYWVIVGGEDLLSVGKFIVETEVVGH